MASSAASEERELDTLPDGSSRDITLPPVDGGRQAQLTLLACCVLQIPVWGFSMSYGVFQEFYTNPHSTLALSGPISTTGAIGTTLTGIIYMSMPFLFGLLARRLTRFRMHAFAAGAFLSIVSIVASAFATNVSHLLLTQAVLQALGATLMYSASTIYIDEWYVQRKGFGYGVTLSTKSAVGVVCPLVFSSLLTHIGFRRTMFIWAGIMVVTILPAPFLLRRRVPLRRPDALVDRSSRRYRRTSWSFMKHRTFPTYSVANMVFSASYGIPQTYLAAFAASALHFSPANAALILVALNLPSIFASLWFGAASDGERSTILGGRRLSISTVSCLSAFGAALPVLFLWGFVPESPSEYGLGVGLLVLFSVVFGFFAGGYSATWGGIVKTVAAEAREREEVVDTGLLMGLMNGARGVGYVVGGLLGVELLKTGSVGRSMLAYGGDFGSLILFSGCGAAVCGLGVLVRQKRNN